MGLRSTRPQPGQRPLTPSTALTTRLGPSQVLVLAYNLDNSLRRLGLPKAIRHWSLRSVQIKLIKIGHGCCATPSGFALGQDDDEAYSRGVQP